MEWLGIHVPESFKEDLRNSQDILQKSVDLSIAIATELAEHCLEKQVPFGFNVESVSIRKEEIEASVELLRKISEMKLT